MGFLDWLTGSARRPPAKQRPKPKPRPKVATAPPPPRAEKEEVFHPVDADDLPGILGFQLPPVFPVEDPDGERAIAEQVLAHFRENRPGPMSFPGLSMKVLEYASREDIDARTLAKTVEQDPALTAAVLKVANSPALRGVTEIGDVREAIARIGTREVMSVAAVVSTRSLFSPEAKGELATWGHRFNGLFHHGATTAFTSAWLALQTPGARSDHVLLAGMLHDVGKGIALRSVAALVRAEEVALHVDDLTVDRVLHQVHVEIGDWLHTEMGLPEHSHTVCIRHHGEAPRADGHLTPLAVTRDIAMVRLVSALYLLRTAPGVFPEAVADVVEAATHLGLDAFQLRALNGELTQASQRLGQLFSVEPLIPRQRPPRPALAG